MQVVTYAWVFSISFCARPKVCFTAVASATESLLRSDLVPQLGHRTTARQEEERNVGGGDRCHRQDDYPTSAADGCRHSRALSSQGGVEREGIKEETGGRTHETDGRTAADLAFPISVFDRVPSGRPSVFPSGPPGCP